MDLPILVLNEFSFAPHLHVAPGATSAYESLWCRLSKLTRWNGLDADQLALAFGREIRSKRALTAPPTALRLRLRHHLHLDDADLVNSLPLPSVEQARALRGCPQCYRAGFHSSLYQLAPITRCPLHAAPLVIGCHHCGRPQAYSITPDWQRGGACCDGCGRRLLGNTAAPSSRDLLPLLPRLTRWRHWLVAQFSHPSDVEYFRDPRIATARHTNVRDWSDGYIEAMPIVSASLLRSPPVVEMEPLSISTEADLIGAASTAYYRIRRVRRRLLSCSNRRSADQILQANFARSEVVMINANVLAFVLWRVMWERLVLSHTKLPVSKRRVPLGVDLCLARRPLKFDARSKQPTIDRIHNEMLVSFGRCLALAAWMNERGGVRVPISTLLSLLPVPVLCATT